MIFSVIAGAIVLIPPMVIGAWRRRRDAAFGPYLGYGVLLFAFSAIVSAVHVPGGTFIHSAVALIPHGYVLALEGVVALVAWIARRRRTWDLDRAGRVFAGGAVAFGVLAGIGYAGTVHATWAEKRDRTLAAGAALDAAGAPREDRVMSIDASGTRYWTGHPGVVLVNDALETVRSVADAYSIRWLILERDDSVPAAAAILIDGQRPSWVGPPILLRPDIGVYPVCVFAGDPRCSSIALAGAETAPGSGTPGR
jgi:hypothetical protein